MSVKAQICGVVSASGRFLEPLACGHLEGHGGPHAWASLPTFIDGRPVFSEGKPGAVLDVELVITRKGDRRWQWEVRNLTSTKRTDFGWETTERKAWVKALTAARAGFGPEGKS